MAFAMCHHCFCVVVDTYKNIINGVKSSEPHATTEIRIDSTHLVYLPLSYAPNMPVYIKGR